MWVKCFVNTYYIFFSFNKRFAAIWRRRYNWLNLVINFVYDYFTFILFLTNLIIRNLFSQQLYYIWISNIFCKICCEEVDLITSTVHINYQVSENRKFEFVFFLFKSSFESLCPLVIYCSLTKKKHTFLFNLILYLIKFINAKTKT